ncbi:MAG: FkbM family methyltransferase [Magnetococcales bacterium]|nr:FkbM family methyltransferase [Magnetococcales bacterium]
MPFQLRQLLHRAHDYFMNDDACRITYSQFGEDVVIHHLLIHEIKKQGSGFYVDIGAFHPRDKSNTKFLSILGWKGINVDANEASIALFRRERPNDINLCCGVALKAGEMTYYKFSGVEAANTVSPDTARKYQEESGRQLSGTSIIPVLTINQILGQYLGPNQEIDVMNIDIEGLDEEVVQSMDLSQYRPKILLIELNDLDKFAVLDNPAVRHLRNNDYSLFSINIATSIFVDNKARKI